MKRPGGFDGDEPGVQDEVRTDRELRAPIPLPTWRLSRKTAATADVDPDERSEAAAEGPAEASGEVSVETPADAQVPAVPVVAKSSVDLAGQDQDDDPVRSAQQELKRARRSVRRRERKEQRRFTAHLRRRRRVWLVAGGAVVALALFVVVGAFSPLMAVREVQIVGASQVNVDELQGALARFDGTPLALVDEREVHRALEPFPLIQRYSVERIAGALVMLTGDDPLAWIDG